MPPHALRHMDVGCEGGLKNCRRRQRLHLESCASRLWHDFFLSSDALHFVRHDSKEGLDRGASGRH